MDKTNYLNIIEASEALEQGIPALPRATSHGSDIIVSLMLDSTPLKAKPSRDEIWRIAKGVAQGLVSIPLNLLAKYIVQGHTFSTSAFKDGKRSIATWVHQKLFGLDFDHGMTLDMFKELCKQWGVYPFLVYPTFSHRENGNGDRFRAVFVCDQVIRDARVAKMTISLLIRMFTTKDGGPDPQCKDLSRMFFGTNKPPICEDYSHRINPIELLDKLLKAEKKRRPKKYADFRKRIATETGIENLSSRLGVDVFRYISERENMNSLDLLYSEDVNSLSTDLVSLVQWQDKVFAIKWSDNKTVSKKSNKTKNKNPRKSRARNENSESNKPQKRLYDKDKEILIEKCPLTREFISGSKHLPHQLRRIMLTNLRHRRGGVKWFMEGLKSRDDYTPDTLIEDARWYDMKPEGCRNCPYCNECDHKTNLLQQLPPRRYECRRIAPDTVRITLAETQQLLGEAITKACKADDKKIYVIRADTGTGKTEEVLKQLLKDTCIASPTHDLAQETYSRYVATGRNGAFLWKPRPKLDDGVLNALGLEGETDEL